MNNKDCSEQFLPLCLCNFDKLENMNRNIFKRNFPSDKMPISYSFRSNYPICKGGVDVNKNIEEQKQATHIVNRNGVKKLQTIFNPSRGSYCGYCQVVNVESDLKNINRPLSLCPKCKYQMDPNCLICKCNKSIGFCDKVQNNNNYQPQVLNKNLRSCDQEFANITDGNYQYNPYPSFNVTDVGIVNPVYKQPSNFDNQRNDNLLNMERDGINLCNENISLPKCKNNNYMRGYFIGSAMSDIKAMENGFKDINNGCNKWEKYKDVLNKKEMLEYDVVEKDFNTVPFILGKYGVPHNDYLSNEQQCQNLYNNMTKVKCLYGKPTDKVII